MTKAQILVVVVLDLLALGVVTWASWMVRRARVDVRRAKRASVSATSDAEYWRSIAIALVTPAELYEIEAAVPRGLVAGGVVEQTMVELQARERNWRAGDPPLDYRPTAEGYELAPPGWEPSPEEILETARAFGLDIDECMREYARTTRTPPAVPASWFAAGEIPSAAALGVVAPAELADDGGG